MNGFANGIMSMLLGWIKVLIGDLWKLVTSPDGDALYKFFSENWKTLLFTMVIIGIALDAVIYFLRWRPDFIWASRREAKRMERGGGYEPSEPEPPHAPQTAYEDEYGLNPYKRPQSVAYAAYSQPVSELDTPTNVYQPPAATMMPGVFAPPAQAARGASQMQAPREQASIYSARGSTGSEAATVRFAPMARISPQSFETSRYTDTQQDDSEPVFDEELGGFFDYTRVDDRMINNPARGMLDSFGNAIPEPTAYLRDMQAGFAPQLTPEQMYPSNEEPRPADISRKPTHPGLGADLFRQSFGLSYDDYETAADPSGGDRTEPAPAFTPYADALNYSGQNNKRSNPFAAIAKKARNLVGDEDDAHKPTIRDLQPAVDMRKAFHEPVYPRAKSIGKGD